MEDQSPGAQKSRTLITLPTTTMRKKTVAYPVNVHVSKYQLFSYLRIFVTDQCWTIPSPDIPINKVQYMVVSGKKTWENAKQYCKNKNKGYSLAAPHSEDENTFMSKLLSEEFWIGGHWKKGEGFQGLIRIYFQNNFIINFVVGRMVLYGIEVVGLCQQVGWTMRTQRKAQQETQEE